MSAHKVYKPENTVIIKQERSKLPYSNNNDETLYKVIDIQFVNYEWIHLASWKNETDQTDEYEHTFSPTLSIMGDKSEEINAQWNFKAMLKGLSAVINGLASTITEDVVPTTANSKATIKVLPKSSVHLYQKRYSLKPVVWFQLNAGCQVSTVGLWKRDGVATREASVKIDSSDYLTTTKALLGSDSLNVVPALNIQTQINTKQWQDCPGKCQGYLNALGV
jgi:hypothetical protein